MNTKSLVSNQNNVVTKKIATKLAVFFSATLYVLALVIQTYYLNLITDPIVKAGLALSFSFFFVSYILRVVYAPYKECKEGETD